jgi:hypothetical protein
MNTTAAAPQTKIERHFYSKQLSAETYFDLKKEGYKLRVSTSKGSQCITTYCQAVKLENNIESFVMFGDFSKRIMTHTESKRATEKSIKECNDKALKDIQLVIDEANEFYNKEQN